MDFGFYNMDCIDGMAQLPDKFFDLAIVDPPYGIGVNKMWLGKKDLSDKSKSWDDDIPSGRYFSELSRVSKNRIIWGGNYFDLPPTRCFLIWDKGEQMYGRSFSECEYAWTSFSSSARIFKYSPRDKSRIHPTQKPVALYQWLLQNYAKPGDKILDTHVGSASSLIACYNLGYDYVGFEVDKDYYEAATKRINAVKEQGKLF